MHEPMREFNNSNFSTKTAPCVLTVHTFISMINRWKSARNPPWPIQLQVCLFYFMSRCMFLVFQPTESVLHCLSMGSLWIMQQRNMNYIDSVGAICIHHNAGMIPPHQDRIIELYRRCRRWHFSNAASIWSTRRCQCDRIDAGWKFHLNGSI